MKLHNFGHVKEKGVVLLTERDSYFKHKRNIILAICVIATLIFFPVGLPFLGYHANKEFLIRWLNKYEGCELPYSKCVELEDIGWLFYKGVYYKYNIPSYDD